LKYSVMSTLVHSGMYANFGRAKLFRWYPLPPPDLHGKWGTPPLARVGEYGVASDRLKKPYRRCTRVNIRQNVCIFLKHAQQEEHEHYPFSQTSP
jgi:hypothetical protein